MVLLELIGSSLAGAASFLAQHYIFSFFFIGLPLAFFVINSDWTSEKLPPRFNYFFEMISGKFSMEANGPVEFIQEGFNRHGPIFRIKVAHKGITFLIGPDGNKFFYNTSDKVLTAREVYHFTVPVFGRNIVYDAPLPLMQRQLSFLRHALNGKNMQTYVDKVLMECDLYFRTYPKSQTVNLHKEFSALIINTASRCLMGDEVRETLHSSVTEQYEYLNDGMTRLSMLFPYFPHPKHTKRDAARREMVRLFEPIITNRRARKEQGLDNAQDFLQELVDCRYENRRELTVDEIVGLLIACLFAGQHTSNITSTWIGVLIAAHKDTILPRLLKEQQDILGPDFKDGDELPYEAVQQMTLLHFCIKEALRMFPPIVVMMRTVQEAQHFNGYTIPAGDIVVSSPAVSHRLPDVFKKPFTFDPDRFLPPRGEGEDIIDDEGNITKQWSYIAFGEGRHQCLGRDFAFLQVKTIFSYLFRHFDWELTAPFVPKQDFSTLVAGPGCDCNVKITRRTKA